MRRVSILGLGLLLAGAAPQDAGAADVPARMPAVPGIEARGFDSSVRPQDDFFHYVNGGWIKQTEIPADFPMYGSFLQLFEASEQAQRDILAGFAARKDLAPGSLEQKLGDFYASFLDEAGIEALGNRPIQERLAKLRAIHDKPGLARAMGELWLIGVPVPFNPYVEADYDDATRSLLFLGQSGLTLPDRDYYLLEGDKFEALRKGYPGYVDKVLGLAGWKSAPGSGQRLLELETRLAKAQWPVADTQNITKIANKRAVAELPKLSERLPWNAFLEGAGISGLDHVNADEPPYLAALGEALDGVPLDTWKDYLAFRLVDDSAPHLPKAFVQASFDYKRNIAGLKAIPERWKRGVRQVNAVLGEGLGKFYVEQHFPAESKRRMELMVANIMEAMRDGIDQLDWMSDATKAAARVKLAKFKPYIGHPEKWRDYGSLEVRRGDDLGNYWRANSFEQERQKAKLGQPVDRDEWTMSPQEVNAYYSPPRNKIVFPAAILQPPFFDPAADNAVNYGAIGAVIGHEISHGFDDEGRKYDGDGNVRDWWTEADNKAFLARADVLVKQYDAFKPLPDLHVNGELTLGENIGDLSGLTIALAAYRRSLEGKPAPVIGGLTGEQRFFIGFAQIWRTKMRDEFLRVVVVSNEHSPGQYRVNGVLANMPEFYQAFGVKPGDGLYLPEAERVKIW
jgi:putative endopeptidase